MDTLNSQPITPTSPTALIKEKDSSVQQQQDPSVPIQTNADARTTNIELLREQLRAAKVPITKRASISEVPQSAVDCSFVPGTTRCSLPLCEDSCTQRHSHHRTHARPSKPDAPLVYSRPSISLAPGTNFLAQSYQSQSGTPTQSEPTSQNNSPRQQAHQRRASAFGFNFGTRGSIISTTGFSGAATPHDVASSPPSPLSGEDSASEPTSPAPASNTRGHHNVGSMGSSSMFTPAFPQPIAEEKEQTTMESSSSQQQQPTHVKSSSISASSSSLPATANAMDTDYWKLSNRVINLHDYLPTVVGLNTHDSLTQRDLAAAPRDDCPDQINSDWDPRSPQPPSPLTMTHAQVLRVNMPNPNSIEYELKPTR